ncbi:MAG: FKBP-type peptidyl-prolyl cis-trans isomerase [Bacteroidota bacterium]
MKSLTWIIALMGIAFFTACDESVDPEEQLEIDKALIQEYTVTEGIDGGFFTDSGLFVLIEDEGEGLDTDTPELSSIVEIVYTGTLLDGSQFDSSDGFPVQFQVFRLIQGWQEGLTYFPRGSSGTLIVPSRLGYGPGGTSGIPGNAVLRFDIEMLDFQ